MSGICDTCQRNQVCRKPMDGMDSCRLYVSGKESNYTRLFGTPERAMRTIAAIGKRYPCDDGYRGYVGRIDKCRECPFADAPSCLIDMENVEDSTLLKWLSGEELERVDARQRKACLRKRGFNRSDPETVRRLKTLKRRVQFAVTEMRETADDLEASMDLILSGIERCEEERRD